MDRKREILELRERLDKTLALPDLSNEELIKSLIKNQLLKSSAFTGDANKLVEKRTKEVSNFIKMLRSASENDRRARCQEAGHIDWKIKQDTDELRVMYHEGPQGSPFHSLLAEGYADGPLDVCLCVSWESSLYKKWFPEYKVPTFKVISSTPLQKVRVGEEISLVRVKVPWPVTDREALLHYFEIEYLQEDLILVLINTILSREQVDESTDGFSGSVIPEAKDATRIDIIGGFVLQKIDLNRSYFRTIANMDIKLDFVPPWIINFTARQLIGNGHKLFQKVLRSVAIHDEDYLKALEGPMYAHIRESLAVRDKSKLTENGLDYERPTLIHEKSNDDNAAEIMSVGINSGYSEIVEEEIEQISHVNSGKLDDNCSYNFITGHQVPVAKEFNISPEVEHALRILDSTIAVLRTQKTPVNQINYALASKPAFQANQTHSSDASGSDNSADILLKNSQIKQPGKVSRDALGSFSSSEKKIVNPEPENDVSTASGSSEDKLFQNSLTASRPPFLEPMNKVCDEDSLEANGFHTKNAYNHKAKHNFKTWLCCFAPTLAKG